MLVRLGGACLYNRRESPQTPTTLAAIGMAHLELPRQAVSAHLLAGVSAETGNVRTPVGDGASDRARGTRTHSQFELSTARPSVPCEPPR